MIEYTHKYLLVSTVRTRMNTKAPWLSQRPEFEALELLYCSRAAVCCCCNHGCPVAFEIPRKCGFISPCPLRSIVAPLLILCVRSYWKRDTHTHTQMRPPWPSQTKERNDARLLLPQNRAWGLEGRCDIDMIQREKRKNKKSWNVGFSFSCEALTRRKAMPWLLASSRDLERPERTPQGPAGAQTCALCTSGPPACPAAKIARKDPRPEKKRWSTCKKSAFGTYIVP